MKKLKVPICESYFIKGKLGCSNRKLHATDGGRIRPAMGQAAKRPATFLGVRPFRLALVGRRPVLRPVGLQGLLHRLDADGWGQGALARGSHAQG